MIQKLIQSDRDKIQRILIDTKHFNDDEIKVAIELIDVYLNDEKQTDYIIYVYGSDDTNETAGYIWIAVDPNIHGKGLGSQLVKHMEEDLLNNSGKIILIETSGKPEYENERKFYTKNGYDVQTIIKDFYRSGDDLYVYRKYL